MFHVSATPVRVCVGAKAVPYVGMYVAVTCRTLSAANSQNVLLLYILHYQPLFWTQKHIFQAFIKLNTG